MESYVCKAVGNIMCMDDLKNNIYLGFKTKAVSYPDSIVLQKPEKAKGGLPCLSEDGRFLLTAKDDGWIEMYDTLQMNIPIFKHHWPSRECIAEPIFYDNSFLVPIRDSIYAVCPSNPENAHLIYGPEQRGAGWVSTESGNCIAALSAYGDNLVIGYMRHDEYPSVALLMNWAEKRIQSTRVIDSLWASDIHSDSKGRIIRRYGAGFALYNSWPNDFNTPDRVISIPGVSSIFQFTICQSGQYLSANAINHVDDRVNVEYLIDTNTWRVVEKVENIRYSCRFSNKSKHWLVEAHDRDGIVRKRVYSL